MGFDKIKFWSMGTRTCASVNQNWNQIQGDIAEGESAHSERVSDVCDGDLLNFKLILQWDKI